MIFSLSCGAVLPAILVASTVFSGLTLPFFFDHSPVESANPDVKLPFLHEQLQPILLHQNRDLTIRYIGGAMVLSVAAGLSTLELQRRWSAAIRQRQNATLPDAASSELTFEASQTGSISALDSVESSQERGWLSDLIASSAEEDRMTWSDATPLLDAAAEPGSIIEQTEELPTCRIWSSNQQRRLLAVQFEGQYYSFFRLFATHAEALEVAQQLSLQQHHLVITLADQMYALWVLQPEAQPTSLLL